MKDEFSNLLDQVHPDDKKYVLKTPDAGFSPERNRMIVEQTITEYEAMRAKKLKDRVAEYEERADAVVTYLKHLDKGHGESDLLKYFGKRNLAYLRGLEIKEKLMSGMTAIKRGS